jgi:two-component system heavy metal sensor histidine kinase CusS
MKLRQRMAVTFAAATSFTVAVAFLVTLTVFKHAQERQLDHALLLGAAHQAEIVHRLGHPAQHLEIGGAGDATDAGSSVVVRDLDYLEQYNALYLLDGSLQEDTPNFNGQAPTLASLGWRPSQPLPQRSFDFRLGGQVMRGVLVRVNPGPATDARLLLLAAPRGDVDADTYHLMRVMAVVFLCALGASLILGWQLGRHMTRGVETIAEVARRISQGKLSSRVALRDITPDEEIRTLGQDLNQMVDRLSSLIAAGQRFVSHAAHELRSPLAALRGELELALRHPRDSAGYQASIQEALADTNRLIALAEDLLVLARQEMTAPYGERAPVSLPSIVQEAVHASLARSSAEVEVDVEVGEMSLPGRGADLVRMVRNLLDNAISHSPRGSRVRVTAVRQKDIGGEQVTLAVEDHGPGVPVSIRDRIFEPFFRGDEEREHSGAGLGLSIAREIARAHSGDLRLDESANRTRFVATLPIR